MTLFLRTNPTSLVINPCKRYLYAFQPFHTYPSPCNLPLPRCKYALCFICCMSTLVPQPKTFPHRQCALMFRIFTSHRSLSSVLYQ